MPNTTKLKRHDAGVLFVRITTKERALVKRLSDKLGRMSDSQVVRLALQRLAEAEKV